MPRRERQAFARTLTRAFATLSSVLGCAPQDLGLEATLTVAFGARGRGGRDSGKGHYEAGAHRIALTRRRGAGAIAHEWCHALDDALGATVTERKMGCDTERTIGGSGWIDAKFTIRFLSPYASACAKPTSDGPAGALARIALATATGPMADRAHALDEERQRRRCIEPDYWSRPPERVARSFEAWVRQTLAERGRRAPQLVSYPSACQWRRAKHAETKALYPWPDDEETRATARLWSTLFADRTWTDGAGARKETQ